jgi:hypothetical protein
MAGIKQIKSGIVSKNKIVSSNSTLPKLIEKTIVEPNRAPSQGVFYPSSLGSPCDRYLYLAYNGQLPPMDVNPKLQRVFDHGGTFEDRMEHYLTKAEILVDREVVVKYADPPISGRLDFLIKDKDESTVVLELKTIKSSLFTNLFEPKPEHLVQVQLYLNTTEYSLGYIIYENKDTLDWKCFKIKQDEKMWQDLTERCHTIMSMTTAPEKCTGAWYCDCKKVSTQGVLI